MGHPLEGDGYCGYHSLVLGTWVSNLDSKSIKLQHILKCDDLSIKLCQELCQHALKLVFMKKILESCESLQNKVHLHQNTLLENLHSTIKNKVNESRQLAKQNPSSLGINDDAMGFDCLGIWYTKSVCW